MPSHHVSRNRPRIGGTGMALLLLVAAGKFASAATLLVDMTSDDGSAPFSVCDGDSDNANCSLRGAINAANASADSDQIHFSIPPADAGYQAATQHWRFSPASEYPFVQGSLSIDGYTQPGALANTNAPDEGGSNAVLKIELRGPGPNSFSGLRADFASPGFLVRGLAIGNFNVGLSLSGVAKTVEGCFLGTDITGSAANPNRIGIRATEPLVVGGTNAAMRNVISGNEMHGIWLLAGGSAAGLSIRGNLIGSNAAGTAIVTGQDYGLMVPNTITDASIGGADVLSRNLFAGNEINALYLSSGGGPAPGGAPLAIIGNYFGTDWTGTHPLPNGSLPSSPSQPQSTINAFKAGHCKVRIGGDASGEGNLIAYGKAAGVQVATCTQAPILGNRFVGNRIAVDLSLTSNADGPTPNDANDPDANDANGGGNRLQNYPEIIDLMSVNGGLDRQLRFRVDTAVANASYPLRVDIATGRSGQPEAPILSTSIAAIDAQQVQTVTFPAAALTGALVLSATDADGNSSEFGSDVIFAHSFDR